MKCLYCGNKTENLHFQSACCKNGMCEYCYQSLIGTEEQLQLTMVDNDSYQEYSKQINKAEKEGYDYLCYNHLIKN